MTKVIGLTGGIATGKSTISKKLSELGYKVICADQLAHQCLEKDSHSYQKIIQNFGKEILDQNQNIDRKKLGSIVFKDQTKLEKLNQMIHPEVRKKLLAEIKKSKLEKLELIFLDIPLLFETNLNELCDYTICVFASKELQIARMKARDNLEFEEINDRLLSQLPIHQKVQLADFVLHNQGSLKDTYQELNLILTQLNSFIE